MGVKTCIWNGDGLCLFSIVATVGSLRSVVSSSRPKLPLVKWLFRPIGELLVVCFIFRILMVVRPCWLPRCRGVRARLDACLLPCCGTFWYHESWSSGRKHSGQLLTQAYGPVFDVNGVLTSRNLTLYLCGITKGSSKSVYCFWSLMFSDIVSAILPSLLVYFLPPSS